MVNKYNLSLIPLVDFGKYAYGDLSYSYGPLAIKAIEDKIGTTNIDQILSKMLIEYKDNEIDFELFLKLFEKYDIKDIIEDYFHTVKGQNYILSN